MDEGDWIARAVARHERPLMQYATHLLRDAEAARDVVQETFCRLCRQSPASLDGHLAEWLYTVCRNRAMDVLRKEQRMRLVEMEPPQAPPASRAAEHREEISSVLHAMGGLPANQQEVVRLKFQQELSYKQIAEVTGLSVSNVGYLLHTALNALRRKLHEEHEGAKNTKKNER